MALSGCAGASAANPRFAALEIRTAPGPDPGGAFAVVACTRGDGATGAARTPGGDLASEALAPEAGRNKRERIFDSQTEPRSRHVMHAQTQVATGSSSTGDGFWMRCG